MNWEQTLEKNRKRIQYTQREFRELILDINKVVNSGGVSLEYKISEDRLSYEVLLRINNSPDIDEWAHKTGNILHNLRSSLDNLIETLGAVPGSQVPRRPNMVHFPIAKTRAEWKSEKSRVSHLKMKYFNRIRDVQPFNRVENGGKLDDDGLLLLSILDNSSKHKIQLEAKVQLSSMNLDSAVKYDNDEEASKSVPPNIEIRNVTFKTGEVLMIHRGGKIAKLEGKNTATFDIYLVHDGKDYKLADLIANLAQYTQTLFDYVVKGV